jgi:hypothetical protein
MEQNKYQMMKSEITESLNAAQAKNIGKTYSGAAMFMNREAFDTILDALDKAICWNLVFAEQTPDEIAELMKIVKEKKKSR